MPSWWQKDWTLTLADKDKDSGCCGSWRADYAGILAVHCTVFGAGTWVSDEWDIAGRFDIGGSQPGCVIATGNVVLTGSDTGEVNGTVVLFVSPNGLFCTEGMLTHQSVIDPDDPYDWPSRPQILAKESVAEFGMAGCGIAECP